MTSFEILEFADKCRMTYIVSHFGHSSETLLFIANSLNSSSHGDSENYSIRERIAAWVFAELSELPKRD
jgi:hypothetical protein